MHFVRHRSNTTDSLITLDTAYTGEYTNLNDYNFLRSNRSIFPTFDNQFVITPTFGDTFGIAVAISGDGSTLAIGETDPSAPVQIVNIYKRFENSWVFFQQLNSPSSLVTTFGASISLSYDGSILAVGSPSLATGNFSSQPIVAIFMYEYNTQLTNYTLVQTIALELFHRSSITTFCNRSILGSNR